MPVMDGLELIEAMEQDQEINRIPIIILTNLGSEADIKKASELKSHFYLIKSLFTPDKVLGMVKEVLNM